MSGLGRVLAAIGEGYPDARTEAFKGHPMLGLVRREAPAAVRAALEGTPRETYVRGSAGPAAWATIPWVAVFDGHVTRSARRGFYVVYLWRADGSAVFLSLIVGTQDVRRAHGDEAREVLRERAWALRADARAAGHALPGGEIDLGSDKTLPCDYEAGHAMGYAYETRAMPDEAVLARDLRAACAAMFAVADARGLSPAGP